MQFVKWPEDTQQLGETEAMLARFQTTGLPERLAVPAAMLVIVAASLLLWSAIGATTTWLVG